MITDVLTLTSAVQVARESVSTDGMGGTSAVTTLTTLTKAAIWQAGANNRYLSDRMTRASTHVLALETSGYTWSRNDRYVVYGGETYKIVGRPDDVANQSELTIVGLELLT